MKGSITRKLFFAILAASVLVAIAMGVAMRLSFDAGFVDYVSERETQRLRDLSDVVGNAYRENGSWEFLRDNAALWQQLNAPHFPGSRSRSWPPRGGERQPGERGQSGDRRAPAGEGVPGERQPPPEGFRAAGPGFSGRDGLPSHRDGFGGGPMSGLIDAAKKPVVGNTTVVANSMLQPVIVEGKTVGWLTGNFISRPLLDLDRQFEAKQQRATWAIGAFALVLSAIVALLLARGLLAPVRALAAATHRLAAGDYKTRVPASGSDELGQLSEDFNRLARALERTEQMRRDFTADISHELRTPLAVLRGELEALQDGIRTPTRESLASLQAEVATLSMLIDDLYDLALADVGALAYRREPMPIVPTVERALGAFRERLAAQRIEVETRFPSGASPWIDGDPERLMQLFNNLFENTIRYTDPDGKLRITIARDGEHVRLLFQDSSPGVPEELLPRIFERLFRVEGSRSRASGGAGLGLSLCESIVDAHGGSIEARPSPLGGVSIEISLPMTKAPG